MLVRSVADEAKYSVEVVAFIDAAYFEDGD